MGDLRFIEWLAERDIDLLLLEELHVSASFRSWLVGQAFGRGACFDRFLGAWHSVSHATLGESDLLLLLADTHGQKTALLIEDKIDAVPQPEQGARYRLRGQAGLEDGSWTGFRTCIVAPQVYLDGTSDARSYDSRLSYESIRDWFRRGGQGDERAAYKARFVQEAIDQIGRQPTPHPAVTRFWADYWRLACAEFPQLRMKQPGQVPAESDWPQFRPPQLGPGRRIVHKMAEGIVDLELASAGGIVEQLAARNREVLTGELEVVRTGKSASVRLRVREVDRFGDLSAQADAVRAGLSAASRLLALSSRIEAG